MDLTLRSATISDSDTLAALNQELIEAEGSRNPMSLDELRARMRGWLEGEWSAIIIDCGGRPAGYCLYQIRSDAYCPERPLVYVRHYCLSRDMRGQGLGRKAFGAIVSSWFPQGARLTLDVLESNPSGRAFWSRLGFSPYCTTLERLPEQCER